MLVRNITRGTDVADKARLAQGFWSRLIGLLGRSSLQPGEALVLESCRSIHTAFMRFTIDAVYIDRKGQVIKLVAALKPFRLSGVLRGAASVIELPSGTIARTDTALGDELSFES